MPHTEYPQGYYDYVEFTNIGTTPVDISGWFVTDSGGDTVDKAERFTLPAGSILQPGQFYIVTEKDLSTPLYILLIL